MHHFTLKAVTISAALAAGCAGGVGYSVSSEGYGSGPDLVYAAPGVQVIANYDEPIFYSDNYYWRNDGGRWSRSTSYTGGWGYATAPSAVLQIRSPRQYVHYRPQGWVEHRERTRAPVQQQRQQPSRQQQQPRQQQQQPSHQQQPQHAAPQHAAPAKNERRPAHSESKATPQAHDRAGHEQHNE